MSSPNQHLLRTDDVISCCLDLSAPSISFRINGQPVQGMFENFNIDGLFFPVVSFSAGIKLVSLCSFVCFYSHFSYFHRGLSPASLTSELPSEIAISRCVLSVPGKKRWGPPKSPTTSSSPCGILWGSPFNILKFHTHFLSSLWCFIKWNG